MDHVNSQLGSQLGSHLGSQLDSQLGVISMAKQVLPICRSDRWQVHYRLQDLDIFSECLASGDLAVEIVSPVQIVQIRSVLQTVLVPRQALVAWLDRCWQHSH